MEHCIYGTLLGLADGKIVAELSNPAVEEDLLKEIWLMKVNGIPWEDIVQRLRTRTVPAGYTYCTWLKIKLMYLYFNYTLSTIGVTETLNDQMKSILSQLEYRHTVNTYEQNGVPFRTYMYVPEMHPLTSAIFFEWEDESHLLKVNFSLQHKHCIDLVLCV